MSLMVILDLKLRSNGKKDKIPGPSPKGRSSWDEYGHATLLQRGAALRGNCPRLKHLPALRSFKHFHSSRSNADGENKRKRDGDGRVAPAHLCDLVQQLVVFLALL